VVGSQSEAAFAQALKTEAMSPSQANALANDSLRKFSRTVTAEQANNLPEDQLWIWGGPVDGRTSDECLNLISAGPQTRDQINAMYPGAFTSGTHFGCRHQPQPYVRERQDKAEQAKRQREK